MVNHHREGDVYDAISGASIAENLVYFDKDTGFKISEYIDGAHLCDPENREDLQKAMKKLRQFHEANLTVAHTVDLFEMINHYEAQWKAPSVYRDYETTKEHVFSLARYIDSREKAWCLTHFDAVPENFLIADTEEAVRLIDWEYAAMQDPHVDIAMFCLQAMYDRPQVDGLIAAYFPEGCPDEVRLKIYCYISVCGLLWSNWCEYQIQCGTEFDAYALRQYRFAKDYYRIVQRELNQ
jgi:thiamine kinase-like enzyme